MTSPIDSNDPLAVIAAQQAALAAATWRPLDAVAGIETATVQGITAARRAGTTGPVLWLDGSEWADYLKGDEGMRLTLESLAGR